ncbi:hypothetical protein ACM66B_001815 [Microbotryomycetes sp. NB124-2]
MPPSYLKLKATALLMRTVVRLTRKWPSPSPDHVLWVCARDGHQIKINLYDPVDPTTEEQKHEKVLINMHGSGFVLTCHGESERFCRLIANETRRTVYDVSYRLAPEWPFPHAYNDVEDVLSYIVNNVGSQSIVISGFSAGGNLALTVSSNAPLELRNKVQAVVTFYPADLSTPFGIRIAPEAPKEAPYSLGIPQKFMKVFDEAYLGLSDQVEWLNNKGGAGDQQEEEEDLKKPKLKKDPRLSMSTNESQLESMPDTVVVFTGGRDSLEPEAKDFVEQLKKVKTRAQASGVEGGAQERKIVYKMFAGRDHAWDINCNREGDAEARDEAYSMVVDILNGLEMKN